MKKKEFVGESDCCEASAYRSRRVVCSECGEDCEVIEPDPPDSCLNCYGTGEVGPFGWEYPEYKTCPDCRGSGLADDGPDPDGWHDGRVDRENGA